MMNKYLVLILCSLLLVACGKSDEKQQEEKSKFQLHFDYPFTAEQAEIYYIDFNDGADSNDGRSHLLPWQSFANLPQLDETAYNLVLIKTGGVYRGSLEIEQDNIWLDRYTVEEDGRVHNDYSLNGVWYAGFFGNKNIKQWQLLEGQYQDKIYTFDANDLNVDWQKGENGLGHIAGSSTGSVYNPAYFLPWKGVGQGSVQETFSEVLTANQDKQYFSYDNKNRIVYLYSQIDPKDTFSLSTELIGIKAKGQKNIHISGVGMTGFSLHGIQLEDCDNCSVKRSVIAKVGGAVLADNPEASSDIQYLYAGNGIEFAGDIENAVIDFVNIIEAFDSCISPQTYTSGKRQNHILLSELYLSKCGFAGIEVSVLSNNGATNSSIDNIEINNVTITESGKGWSGQRYGSEGNGIRIKADAGAGTIGDVKIIRAKIENSISAGILISDNVKKIVIDKAKTERNESGIKLAQIESSNIELLLANSIISDGVELNSASLNKFEAFYNTFLGDDQVAISVFSGKPNSLHLHNNLYATKFSNAHLYLAGDYLASMDNNCYQALPADMFGVNGVAYLDLAMLASVLNHGTNSAEGDLAFKPTSAFDPDDPVLFVSDPYTPKSDSPCRELADTNIQPTIDKLDYTDFYGKTISTPAAAGAVQ